MDMGMLGTPGAERPAGAAVSAAAGKVISLVAGKAPEAPDNQNKTALPAVVDVQPADRQSLEKAVSDMQDFVQSVRRDINFQLDDGTGQVVVRVTEAATGDVIRQIPSEEALRLAENLSEIRSLLFEAEA
ncbi:flagellar protein FlaG [Halopseudomonas phragmitis]|uniref:Flagellar biosynthesis protein FlaG n=2 Tax=Pseudomonadaceae TaxID=135621 RepID=A0A1V0B4Y6_9GAMM|nr:MULTISPECIES: flagellar protein FlaG [Pseudomonadaceae]AQZ94993.1 hypothetical protein BVH74_09625 [Halopseudomonas phragmitis]